MSELKGPQLSLWSSQFQQSSPTEVMTSSRSHIWKGGGPRFGDMTQVYNSNKIITQKVLSKVRYSANASHILAR